MVGPARALEIAADRVRQAEELIQQASKLRRTLGRHNWLGAGWYSNTTVGTVTATLKMMVGEELEAVSVSARKLGGDRVVTLVANLDAMSNQVFAPLDPPDDAGVPEPQRSQLREVLDGG
jgi:hypothetical protein